MVESTKSSFRTETTLSEINTVTDESTIAKNPWDPVLEQESMRPLCSALMSSKSLIGVSALSLPYKQLYMAEVMFSCQMPCCFQTLILVDSFGF